MFDEIETRNIVQFRADSKQLEDFRRGCFQSMETELANTFDDTDGIDLRHLPIVQGASEDWADLYINRPTRRFSGVTTAVARALEDAYRRSRLDTALMLADQRAVVQNSLIVAIDPLGARDFRMIGFSPYEYDVQFDDLLDHDLRRARKITLRVPIKQTLEGMTIFGRRVYERHGDLGDHFWTATVEHFGEDSSVAVPLFPQYPTKLPWDDPPVAGLRFKDPPAGYWAPFVPEDLLTVQIGTVIAISDIENICRVQCYGRWVLAGSGANTAPREMQGGPKRLWVFDAPAGSNLTYSEHYGKPPIDLYLGYVERYIAMYERFAHLQSGSLSGITGAAKAEERLSIEAHRRRRVSAMQDFEQDVLDVISMLGVVMMDANDSPRVEVTYHPVEPRENSLQQRQSHILGWASGAWDPVEHEMRFSHSTESEAKQRVEDRLGRFVDWRSKFGLAGKPLPGVSAESGIGAQLGIG